jgi:DNA polymerase-3 subunit beta
MKITVKKTDLAAILHRASTVTETKATMPILSAVLLEDIDGGMTVRAYDLEVGYFGLVAGEVSKPGKVAVSAKTLGDVVKGLPEATVTLSAEKNRLVVTSGGAEYRLATLSADEYPALPEKSDGIDFRLPAKDFASVLGRVGYAQSTDETRYSLNGTLLEGADGILGTTATDGHRLVHSGLRCAAPDFKGVIVSRKTTRLLRSILDGLGETEVSVTVSENAIAVDSEHERVVARLIDGAFPDYAAIYPETGAKSTLDVKELSSVLGRLKVVSDTTKWTVGGGVVKFRAFDPDLGEVEDWMHHGNDAKDIVFGVNGAYIREAVSVVTGGSVDVFFPQDDLTPLVLRYPGLSEDLEDYAIVMPMRVK